MNCLLTAFDICVGEPRCSLSTSIMFLFFIGYIHSDTGLLLAFLRVLVSCRGVWFGDIGGVC